MKNNIKENIIGYVYMWTNQVNNKKYIGLHEGSLDDGYCGSGVLFKKAIKKYTIYKFLREILYIEKESLLQLYQKEFDIINLHDAVNSKMYYNLSNFDPKYVKFIKGEKRRKITKKTRLKMRKCRLGKKASQETRNKMSLTRTGKPHPQIKNQNGKNNPNFGKKWYNNKIIDGLFKTGSQPKDWKLGRIRGVFFGNKNPFFGKSHTEESKQKIRDSQTKRKRNENN